MKKFKVIFLTFYTLCFLSIIITLAIVLLKTDWQFISDQNKAKNFIPSSDIKDITDNLTLTERGRIVFYASSPVLMSGEDFNNKCNNYKNDTYTAGCYYEDENQDEHIVVYDVGGTVLNESGVIYDFSSYRRIVALHEFLHAAWVRLSDSQRDDTCNDLSLVAEQIDKLQSELINYSSDDLCTEMFARIGSEYMPFFMSKNLYTDSAIPTRLSNLSTEAKNSVDKLADIYEIYFDIYNEGLAIDYWKNIIVLTEFENNLANFEASLAANSDTINQMVALYYQSPSRMWYYTVMAAIEDYNNDVARYNSYIETYNKIYEILDSTKLRTANDYMNL